MHRAVRQCKIWLHGVLEMERDHGLEDGMISSRARVILVLTDSSNDVAKRNGSCDGLLTSIPSCAKEALGCHCRGRRLDSYGKAVEEETC